MKNNKIFNILPSHEELHEHVNPHIHHSDVPHGTYHPDPTHEEPLKSRFRLDWIWTKIRIGKFYPFPLVAILLIGIPLIPVILLALGVPLPFSIAELPFLKGILNYIGIYSDKDLFVVSTWVFWWPIFIFTIIIFKRIWCGGFCPFGLVTDIGNFFGKKLRKGEQAKPINIVKYIFIGFLVFKALGYLHDAIGITNSTVLTVEFVIFFIVYAFIIGLIAPRRTFCRVFCFLGSLPHLFGRLSLYTLETDRSKCASCEGQWCITGHKAEPKGITTPKKPLINLDGCPMFINVPQLSHTESNRNCIDCGNCVKNCPYDAIHYKPKVPGYELYKGIDLNFHETIFVLGLIPLLAMFVAMEGDLLLKFATFFQFPINSHWAITGSFFILAMIIVGFVYYLITGLGSLILNINYKLALRNFGYIFLPFAYMVMIRDITITYFLRGSFIPIKFPNVVILYPFLDYFLVLVGVTWSIYMAFKISHVSQKHANLTPASNKTTINTLLHVLPITALAYYWITVMFPVYLETLSDFGIHFMMPFVVSGIIIGAFIFIVNRIGARKALKVSMQAKATAVAT